MILSLGDIPLSNLARGQTAAKQRADEILSRIKDVQNPVVIEVGVNQGNLSRQLLAAREDLTLYMVDSWRGEQDQPDTYKSTKDRNAFRPQSAADSAKQRVYGLAAKYRDRAIIIEADSLEAALYFDDHVADIIFIDADHSYEGVKGDIAAYSRISKMWISGHDYKSQQPQFDFTGVDRAVEEAFGEVETGKNLTWFKRLY